ncbi:domesticated amidase effector 2-like [Dermacentor andersoni]|uniref:domesticated amidase effector 2-like n=1 Tax=Dermacentor andersoni TaxID=34620 RepID=UPI0021555E7C|nr:domesticated amidase effector 2-like [Dermacentor andersoni]
MKESMLLAAFLLLGIVAASEAIECVDPQPFKGDWVTNAENKKQCVILVKEKCTGMRDVPTDKWRRGKQVRTNCDSIPRWTAIGSFMNGDKFNGHAAIFESCDTDGIWVYDQWDAAPVDRRKVPYGDSRPYYNGDNYYMIEL